ncbi:MAG: MlaA family lipoprotein, partial [Methylosarcina sp.]
HDGEPPENDIDDFSLEDDFSSEGDGVGEASVIGEQTGVSGSGIPVTQGGYELGEQNPNNGPAPVINNSRHLLELSAPE